MASLIPLIDLYSFYNEIDGRVIETILEGHSISCTVRTVRATCALSSTVKEAVVWRNVDERNEIKISVEQEKIDDAKSIISNAIKNGVISRDGKFCR